VRLVVPSPSGRRSGSAAAVGADRLVTSARTVTGVTQVTAVMNDGSEQSAKVLWIDHASGMAVLDIDQPRHGFELLAYDVGGRFEHWQASEGRTDFSATSSLTYPERREDHFSPKAALSWQWRDDTLLKASLGRAVRNPTVAELYGATSTANSQFINDPNLRPERSWTAELSAEHDLGRGSARLTLFAEDTRDALYSQTTLDPNANRNITRVQNIGRIATTGVEGALQTSGWLVAGLDLAASVTYTDSKIRENSGFVAVPGDTIGKWQPNIPRWRATALASYRFDERWSASVGARLSGRQYRTLNNADVNGFTYQGVSKYATVDVRVVHRFDRNWSAAVGIDNLNDYHYWNFHPYPQRTYAAELKFDY